MNSSAILEGNTSQFVIRYRGDPDLSHREKQKPISVSSDIAIPNRSKIIGRRLSKREKEIQERNMQKISSVRHSVHTNIEDKKEDKEEKEYSRIPIEYYQERDQGNAADRVRGRVVYRGYAPKNTYYYYKTIKQLRFTPKQKEKDYRGEDVYFNSKFESGNLNAAVRISSKEYWLFMREDTNTHGLRQWYYFEMRSRKSCKIKLRIYKFSKKCSLYKEGMKPFVRTIDSEWHQQGQNLTYEYDSNEKCYFLQFQYNFQEHKEVYFATLPPYTQSILQQYLENLAEEQLVHIKRIGISLSGFDMYAINILGKKHHEDKMRETMKEGNSEKQAVVVIARTHPGETVSNFALQNFIKKVLQTPTITDKYNFYIIPMVNPDGVFLGNHRTGVLGQDLNRHFHVEDRQYYPEVDLVEKYINSVQKRYKIAFMFDLHGHSAKKNIFSFGQQCPIGQNRYLYSRIIPKIISNQIDSFKYDSCLFKATKEKAHTARVYFANRYGINAITFEQSYGLLENSPIGIDNWRNFGTALAESLEIYIGLTKDNPSLNIKAYLEQQIISEKEFISRKIQKKREKEERQKERQKQRQMQELKLKNLISKTQGSEQVKNKTSLIKRFQQSRPKQKQKISSLAIQQQLPISQPSDDQSLSSGDQSLQLKQSEFQTIKKDIVRVGITNKQIKSREIYLMAQKKVQLQQNNYIPDNYFRLHHKQSSIVQRIFKFRSKQKVKDGDYSKAYSFRQPHERQSRIELPVIKK